ncbi:UBX domain-containing protein 6 [Anabrus simplex]|uniref:UBX domain-containing protein 6 n=1 Tax=Anabrus simplex TaxID=316456 RepID=UPI0035A2C96D
MAEKIKKYFQKKKIEAKFKMAGPGYKLADDSSRSSCSTSSRKEPVPVPVRSTPHSNEAKQAAAAAALARLGGQRHHDHAAFNTSLAAIQAQVRRELEAERKAKEMIPPPSDANVSSNPVVQDTSPHLAVTGVYFRCPMIGNGILSKEEWNKKIREFLYEQLEEERGLTACLIIHSCNKGQEKVSACVEILCKYLQNIILNPTEEKYQKIRMSNRAFQERVAPIEGSQDFLLAAGFQIRKQAFQDSEDDFLVFSKDGDDSIENLQVLHDALQSAEPIGLELDRNLQVLLPSQVADRNELPAVFFSISPEELKREQQLRTEAVEKGMMLRTKAMREKEEQREMRRYRYALIRVRFPDGVFLQGTFYAHEKLQAVREFVHENLLCENRPFILAAATGHRLNDEDSDKSLVELHLVPASILIFTWDPITGDDFGNEGQATYLKPEIMLLLQSC